jgi:hypothetical protein
MRLDRAKREEEERRNREWEAMLREDAEHLAKQEREARDRSREQEAMDRENDLWLMRQLE